MSPLPLPTARADLPRWGEREIGRFQFRVALFKRRGWDQWKAETWADRLYERDFERDDRRMCIECSQLQQSGYCRAASSGLIPGASKRHQPVTDVLQRCPTFEFVVPA